MESEIVIKNKEILVIAWSDENLGYGRLTMTPTNTGRYVLDSEYMGINSIIEIFKALK